jgi:hypothetical protein
MPRRELPTSVFIAIGILLLALGATWWTASEPAPPAAARPGAPAGTVVLLRFDDGRIVTYRTGGTLISEPHLGQHRARALLGARSRPAPR